MYHFSPMLKIPVVSDNNIMLTFFVSHWSQVVIEFNTSTTINNHHQQCQDQRKGGSTIPISQVKELRHRDVKLPAQRHRCVGLAKTCVQVCHNLLWKDPNDVLANPTEAREHGVLESGIRHRHMCCYKTPWRRSNRVPPHSPRGSWTLLFLPGQHRPPRCKLGGSVVIWEAFQRRGCGFFVVVPGGTKT